MGDLENEKKELKDKLKSLEGSSSNNVAMEQPETSSQPQSESEAPAESKSPEKAASPQKGKIYLVIKNCTVIPYTYIVY